jgi:hypothetical protein
VDGSQTVRGFRTDAFSIFPSFKPVDLDLNAIGIWFACEVAAVADLSLAALLFSLCVEWRRNPSTKRKWKQVEAPGPWSGLI